MKIQTHGDKLVVTKAIKEYLEEKVARLNKYLVNSDDIKAVVHIRIKNNMQCIEVTIPTDNFTLRAEEKHNDLYASIDLVIDKLERQIVKNKTKLQSKYKSVPEFETELEVEEEETVIVKRKDLSIKPMDEEEAILQMQLVNHDFFVFKNIDEECVSVLYKRGDDKLGIINVK